MGLCLGIRKVCQYVSFGIRINKVSLTGKKSLVGDKSNLHFQKCQAVAVLDNIRLSTKCVVCPSMFM